MSSYLPTFRGFAKLTAGLALGLLGIAAGALWYGQTYIIYPSYVPPGSRETVQTPADFEIPYEDLELTSEDGVHVKAYLLLQRKKLVGSNAYQVPPEYEVTESTQSDEDYAKTRPTVLFFHANAGNVGHRIPLARVFYTKMRCNVIMLSYRGYGRSEGSPTEKGIRLDSQATLDYVLSHPILQSTRLMFYGQSLGGAVAIDLASRNPDSVQALILENTFLSIPLVAKKLVPLSRPFLFLCTEQWHSAEAIKRVRPSTHVLLLSGLRDELVPPEHMKGLWAAVTQDGKERRSWAEFKEGTHNDTCVQPGYWAKVKEFVDNIMQ